MRPLRLGAWRSAAETAAADWVLLLTEGITAVAPQHRAQLHREILAYTGELLRLRLGARRSLNVSRLASRQDRSACNRSLNLVEDEEKHEPDSPTCDLHSTISDPGLTGRDITAHRASKTAKAASTGFSPSRQPEGDPTFADNVDSGELSISGSRGLAEVEGHRQVTGEDFERFCRWTGMDAGCLSGTSEHVASLLFYIVVFSLLCEEGDSPDLKGQQLLQKLRCCRESLTRCVDSWAQEMDVEDSDRGA